MAVIDEASSPIDDMNDETAKKPFVGHPISFGPPTPGEEPGERMSPFLAIILLYGIMILMIGAQVGWGMAIYFGLLRAVGLQLLPL